MTIRVYIIAPTAALRAGLQAMLATPTIEVVGAAAMPSDPAAQSDVVVIGDASLLNDDLQASGEMLPGMVVLAGDTGPISRLRTLPLRGWAVVSPDTSPAELQAAVAAVAQGLVALPRETTESLFNQRLVAGQGGSDEPLTARELEVLALLSQGLPNKLIARELYISEHTVKFHISAILAKLGATSRTEAVSLGARRGLITL